MQEIFLDWKKNEAIKDKIINDIRNLFEHEEEDYYKPVQIEIFWSNNFIEYESKGDRNKTGPIEGYLFKIRLYVKGILNNLQKSDTWKIELTVAINFVSSKDYYKKGVIQTKSNNIEAMINDKGDEVIEDLFEWYFNREQIGLRIAIKLVFSHLIALIYYIINAVKWTLNVVDHI